MNRNDSQEVQKVLATVTELPAIQRRSSAAALPLMDVTDQIGSYADAAPFSLEGKQLGPYRLLAIVGIGGMGTVYRAERTDGRFQKQVAIKVVPAAVHWPELLRRFASEQQILAALEHPNIARLLDAGMSPEGIPYFVMEYVEGTPVNGYCESRRLSYRDRLRLFQTLCSAVQYAHQHLVVHRDLKPANILVNSEGVPKLLDFGIAKMVDPWSAGNAELTRSLLNPMTPSYASPEQVRGEDLTTATDVYSLGVVLYELLTGQLPYEVAGKPLNEAFRVICETEPERPSVLAKRGDSAIQGALRRAPELSSDVDAIVAKAMRKDPRQRYASAEELSADITRYLDGLPVLAHRGSFQYRAGKFIRRHRVAAGAAISGAIVLLGFSATMAVQAQRIARERDRANREAEASKRVTEFMTNMFSVSDPREARGNSVTAREILDKASTQIETGLAKDPELQAQMMDVMGTVYLNLGLYPRARPLVERSADIRLRVLGAENAATLRSRFHLAVVMNSFGQFAEAEKLDREVLDAQRRVLGPENPDTLRSTNTLAGLIERQGRALPEGPERQRLFAEAERLQRGLLEISRRVLGPEHLITLGSMNNLSSTLDYEGRYAEAEKLQRETFDIQRRVLGPEHRDTMGCMNNLAFTLEQQRRYAEAEKIYREAADIQRRVLGPEHPDTLLSLDNLSNTIAEQGRYVEAEKLCRQTLEIRRRVLGPDHPDTAGSKYELAGLLSRQGRRNETLVVLRDAIDHGLDPGTDLSLEKEDDFKSLHGDARFTALLAHAKERAATGQKAN